MRKFILLFVLFAAGCMTAAEKDCKEPEVIAVRDTLYLDPPVPGAPTISSASQYSAQSVGGQTRLYIRINWTKVDGAIGYKVLYSQKADSIYQAVGTGENVGLSRSGVYFILPGTFFFKVVAVNNDGIDGPPSSHVAVVYDGN